MNWIKLESEAELDKIKAISAEIPVLIFKHSTRCSISATALSRFERAWDETKAPTLIPYYLDLIRFRPISSKIADDFGVYHESPQILLIKDGKSVYDESHFGISFDEVVQHI